MDSLLRIGASNALAACALALVAALVGRLCRRPAVAHSLWVLVLLKLVTPPVLPVPVFAPFRTLPAAASPAAPDPGADEAATPPTPEELRQDDGATAVPEEALAAPAVDLPELAAPPPTPTAPATAEAPLSVSGAVLLLWAAGSAAWLVLAGLRTYRFGRLLRFAEPAPAALRARGADLAARLGLPRCPDIALLPGQLSPMLWAVGVAPRIYLPAGLLGRLDPGQQDALLAHELAHLRRRDHWVRALEMLVTVLYWWHPAVWWARRELREAEEQCCDAWVLWALPGMQKTYALALVETVDFLSEARSALPQGASGIGQVHHLRRRITMIMRGTTPRALTWAGGLAIIGLGAVLLPLLPTWEQTRAADPLSAAKDPGAKTGEDATQAQAAKAEALKARAQLELYRAQLAQAQAQYERAMANLKEAEATAKDAEKKAATPEAPAKARKAIIIIEGEDGKEKRVEVLGGKLAIEGTALDYVRVYPPAGVPVSPPQPAPYLGTYYAPSAGRDHEKRLADLEKEVKQLRHELDILKRERQQQRGAQKAPQQSNAPSPFGSLAPAVTPPAPDTNSQPAVEPVPPTPAVNPPPAAPVPPAPTPAPAPAGR